MSNQKKTLLIIDDDEDIRLVVKILFESEDYKVIKANNGIRGLEKAKNFKPDVIILDYHMPEMSGISVLKELRKIERHTPVIMLTANLSQGLCAQAFRDGVNDFVSKPFDYDYLTVIVKRAIENVENNRELFKEMTQRKVAEDLNNAYDEFLSNLSHEFRTPLHAILSFGELAHTQLIKKNIPKATEHLEKLLGAKNRLENLTKSLEEFASKGSTSINIKLEKLKSLFNHTPTEKRKQK